MSDQSIITPAARANDTTDVWAVRHGCYTREPSQPFRSANIDHIQCGLIECDRTTDDFPGANLGLYSMTFVNELEQDREALQIDARLGGNDLRSRYNVMTARHRKGGGRTATVLLLFHRAAGARAL